MKRIFLFILSLVLAFSLACPAFADTESDAEVTIDDAESYVLENDLPESEGFAEIQDGVSTYSSDSVSLVFKKTSTTTAKAQAIAARPGASSVKSTTKLQILNGSTYTTVTNGTATKSVSTPYVNHIVSFSISSRKTYRIKVAIKYTEDGVSYTNYYYKSLNSNGY